MDVVDNILELIGNTPLLRLRKVTEGIDANVFLKLEYLNPSGSYKDRMALKMIENAEKAGRLRQGYTIVESSSGNTAIALSFVGATKGYKVKIFLPEDVDTSEKKKTMTRYGAQIELVPSPMPLAQREDARKSGLPGELIEQPARARCVEEERRDGTVWWARQFSNPNNTLAHEDMGREILRQLDGKVDVWVSSIGTGGNFMGVARVLKKRNPRVRCVAVEPTGWKGEEAVLSGWKTGQRKIIPGLAEISGGITKEIIDEGLADDIVQVGNDEAKEMAYRLSGREGLFCGMSTGANAYVALMEARKLESGKNVVTVAVDRGDRYFNDERYIT